MQKLKIISFRKTARLLTGGFSLGDGGVKTPLCRMIEARAFCH